MGEVGLRGPWSREAHLSLYSPGRTEPRRGRRLVGPCAPAAGCWTQTLAARIQSGTSWLAELRGPPSGRGSPHPDVERGFCAEPENTSSAFLHCSSWEKSSAPGLHSGANAKARTPAAREPVPGQGKGPALNHPLALWSWLPPLSGYPELSLSFQLSKRNDSFLSCI